MGAGTNRLHHVCYNTFKIRVDQLGLLVGSSTHRFFFCSGLNDFIIVCIIPIQVTRYFEVVSSHMAN